MILAFTALKLTGGQTPIINFTSIIKSNGTGSAPALLPGAPLSSSARALRIEFLAVLPLPPGVVGADKDIVLRKLALIACSIHSMEGLEYWSASRGKMRTLYTEADRVDTKDRRTIIADPAGLSDLPAGNSWHFDASLRDLSFGANAYGYEIEIGKSALVISSENLTPVRYLLVPLAGPGALKTRITVMPNQEGIVLHLISTIDAAEIAAKRVFESAGNKSLAVLGWFARKAYEAGLAAQVKIPVDVAAVPSHGG